MPELDPRVEAILRQYARPTDHGAPWQTCQPSKPEIESGLRWTGGKKVIYNDEDSATAAAAALAAIDDGPVQRAYPCPRSRRGHWHLSSRPEPTQPPGWLVDYLARIRPHKKRRDPPARRADTPPEDPS